MEKYKELEIQHSLTYQKLSKQYNLFGLLRFLSVLIIVAAIIIYFKTNNIIFLATTIAGIVGFFILIKIHIKQSFQKKLNLTLVEINKDELDYLNKKGIPFDEGAEYIEPKHAYTFDLDFFGMDSIFQNINRTATYVGKSKLALLLKSNLTNNDILENQEAIAELSEKIELRQNINAIAKIADDNKEIYDKLIAWVKSTSKKSSSLLKLFSFASPIAIMLLVILHIVEGSIIFRSLAIGLFLINIGVLSACIKSIKSEIIVGSKIDEIIKNYSLIIKTIEKEEFKSTRLNQLKGKLNNNSILASQQIEKLSSLFSQLDTLFNIFGAFLTNGLGLYHIHVFRNLLKWKLTHTQYVVEWLDVVGELEALGSLANFSFNNPSFVYPDINKDKNIVIENMGHPLIEEVNRVNNNVRFDKQNFIILTGSNMSGKSTFLRSLGVNMVLAGIGSVICASKANICPLKVWVSMRLSDSLEDNESYFLVEVKRLKEIMMNSENETTFILLDEILRGTNSNDKHTGTVEVIKKIIAKSAVGAIATHDLKVCLITDNYPETLVNKCFEVEIINDELSFDYKLRDGICKNKSATFLMKKMDVI
jgi:DNA mismatch repair ATPase MutS